MPHCQILFSPLCAH